MALGAAAYYRSIAKWLKLRAQREQASVELDNLTRELANLEDHLLPIVCQGPRDMQPGEKVIPVQRLERIPTEDTQRLLDGARYCEQLATEINARRADKHYER